MYEKLDNNWNPSGSHRMEGHKLKAFSMPSAHEPRAVRDPHSFSPSNSPFPSLESTIQLSLPVPFYALLACPHLNLIQSCPMRYFNRHPRIRTLAWISSKYIRKVYREHAGCIPEVRKRHYSNLYEALVAAQVPSNFDSEQLYLPDKAIATTLRYHILEEIKASGFKSSDHEIVRHFLRIFFILVYSRMTCKMPLFLEHQFYDDKLPVEYNIHTGEIIVGGRSVPISSQCLLFVASD